MSIANNRETQSHRNKILRQKIHSEKIIQNGVWWLKEIFYPFLRPDQSICLRFHMSSDSILISFFF